MKRKEIGVLDAGFKIFIQHKSKVQKQGSRRFNFHGKNQREARALFETDLPQLIRRGWIHRILISDYNHQKANHKGDRWNPIANRRGKGIWKVKKDLKAELAKNLVENPNGVIVGSVEEFLKRFGIVRIDFSVVDEILSSVFGVVRPGILR